jgi:hypothetical protein
MMPYEYEPLPLPLALELEKLGLRTDCVVDERGKVDYQCSCSS